MDSDLHVILNPRPDVPMIESILHMLDVYNDAAHRALYVLCQQTLSTRSRPR